MEEPTAQGTSATEGYAMEVLIRDFRLVMAIICVSSLTLGLPLAINMLSQLKVRHQPHYHHPLLFSCCIYRHNFSVVTLSNSQGLAIQIYT